MDEGELNEKEKVLVYFVRRTHIVVLSFAIASRIGKELR